MSGGSFLAALRPSSSSSSWMAGRTNSEEVSVMTESTSRSNPGVKTLGVKLPDELHAQFSMVVSLNGLSLNDGVLKAVQEYVDRNRSEADFAERAAAALAEIEREAAARRGAIQALFGDPVQPSEAAKPGGRRKSGETA